MGIIAIMENHGFSASHSKVGSEWYTKQIKYKGKDAFIAITDDGGLGLPESLDEPVYVGKYDLGSGKQIKHADLVKSLKSYLETLQSE